MSVDLLCMGEPMLEYSQLPADSEGRRLYLEGFGGDTSNTAIAAARQGAGTGYVTAVGEEMGGDAFMQLWRSEGVDTSTVIQRPNRPTAVYFVLRKGDGHEFLFYRAGSGDLVAVEIHTQPRFSLGRSAALFPAAGFASLRFSPQYAVAPDDRRFLMIRAGTPDQLIVVENWFEELTAKSRK